MKTTCVGLQGQQATVVVRAGLLTSILKVSVALLLQCETLFSTLLKDTHTTAKVRTDKNRVQKKLFTSERHPSYQG